MALAYAASSTTIKQRQCARRSPACGPSHTSLYLGLKKRDSWRVFFLYTHLHVCGKKKTSPASSSITAAAAHHTRPVLCQMRHACCDTPEKPPQYQQYVSSTTKTAALPLLTRCCCCCFEKLGETTERASSQQQKKKPIAAARATAAAAATDSTGGVGSSIPGHAPARLRARQVERRIPVEVGDRSVAARCDERPGRSHVPPERRQMQRPIEYHTGGREECHMFGK